MHVQKTFSKTVSQRRACKVLGQSRSTQRYNTGTSRDEDRLVQRIAELARDYGRYGYRRIMALLRAEGWQINHKRMLRLWRREGLKVPTKQPKLNVCGLMTVPVLDIVQNIRTMYGVMIL